MEAAGIVASMRMRSFTPLRRLSSTCHSAIS
jgi:hypothetical protein